MILGMNLSTSALFRLALVGLLGSVPCGAQAARPGPPAPSAPLSAEREALASLMVQANLALQEGQYVEVEKKLNAALKLDPRHAGAERLYGRSREAQQDAPGAMSHYQRYLRLAPETDPGYAAVREKVKRYLAQPGHPAVAVSGRDLAPVPFALAARKDAEALWASAQKAERDHAPARQQRALALALDKLDESLQLNERDAEAFRLRGKLLLLEGRKTEAYADKKRALILEPNGPHSAELDHELTAADVPH